MVIGGKLRLAKGFNKEKERGAAPVEEIAGYLFVD